MCGGTAAAVIPYPGRRGLSPRVRGNPADTGKKGCPGRSIPACAGEPRPARAFHGRQRVYPRVCGGTQLTVPAQRIYRGLSPRVRGNPDITRIRRVAIRSIPACAGEPARCPSGRCGQGVYPRVCGGTGQAGCAGPPPVGLSPRVRGNHDDPPQTAAVPGSIPACAGEPSVAAVGHHPGEVYPRVCGGTLVLAHPNHGIIGLSPRVRGNRVGCGLAGT